MKQNIINYVVILTSLILVAFIGLYIFKGQEILIKNAIFLAFTFIIWMVAINIQIYQGNRKRIKDKINRIHKINRIQKKN